MKEYLLDTHALVDLAKSRPRWAGKLVRAHRFLVSAVSAGELALLSQRKKLPIMGDPLIWFETLVDRFDVEVIPVDARLYVRASQMPWAHGDPSDRIVVQTALHRPTCTLVTRDSEIVSFYAGMKNKSILIAERL